MKGTPLGGAFSYISGRYKEYPRGVHGCIPNDLLYEAPKSQHNLQVDLKVTVMLNYWNQFRKSYTEMLSTISLSPVGRGGGEGEAAHTLHGKLRMVMLFTVTGRFANESLLSPTSS